MAWHDLIAACALVLVFEGIMPFLSPATTKRVAANVVHMPDNALRAAALASMVSGVVVLFWIRS